MLFSKRDGKRGHPFSFLELHGIIFSGMKRYLPLVLSVICIFAGAYLKLEHITGGQLVLAIGMAGAVFTAIWMAQSSDPN